MWTEGKKDKEILAIANVRLEFFTNAYFSLYQQQLNFGHIWHKRAACSITITISKLYDKSSGFQIAKTIG